MEGMTTHQDAPQQPSIADRLLARIGNLTAEYEAKVVQLEDLIGQYQQILGESQAENQRLTAQIAELESPEPSLGDETPEAPEA